MRGNGLLWYLFTVYHFITVILYSLLNLLPSRRIRYVFNSLAELVICSCRLHRRPMMQLNVSLCVYENGSGWQSLIALWLRNSINSQQQQHQQQRFKNRKNLTQFLLLSAQRLSFPPCILCHIRENVEKFRWLAFLQQVVDTCRQNEMLIWNSILWFLLKKELFSGSWLTMVRSQINDRLYHHRHDRDQRSAPHPFLSLSLSSQDHCLWLEMCSDSSLKLCRIIFFFAISRHLTDTMFLTVLHSGSDRGMNCTEGEKVSEATAKDLFSEILLGLLRESS